MTVDIATLFPEMCEAVLSSSIIGRARAAGRLRVDCHDIRGFSEDKHRKVDDSPYGGGMGMVLGPVPIYNCFRYIERLRGARPHTVYLSPKGRVFSQRKAEELAQKENLLLLCGHYEGVDQRILDEMVDEELSIGDYVLTGGELGALVVVDAVGRLCEGVLSDASCYTEESHQGGLLEYPHYTRPPVWHGRAVPEVLLSGHHKNIARWRREESIRLTWERRPDMLAEAPLGRDDLLFLERLRAGEAGLEETEERKR
ncbi:MAG: tRNA (guanosine(37)-N1)-methyltransferase TrmD [Provencibacterium sp.]|jgi:tRNA (guanine37-N1)-methyltransferase|nr:tRNA (guanosine(37)-N1)-methyltransferase TrmD [Provencibacterium sp.]